MKTLQNIALISGLAAMSALTACQTDDVISVESTETAQPTPAPAVTEQSSVKPANIKPGQAECAIYYAVTGQLLIEKRNANGDILAGCSADASVGADISASGSAPSGTAANSLIARMIDKGVPRDVAGQVSRSQAFRAWLQQGG